MKCLVFILSLALLALLTGCGKTGMTNAQLEVTTSFLFSGDYPGGFVIVAHKVDGSERVVRHLAQGTGTLVLSNGEWEFLGILWAGDASVSTGSKALTGVQRCGTAFATLNGQDTPVRLNVTQANCQASIEGFNGDQIDLAESGFVSSNQFKQLLLGNCPTIPSPLFSSSCAGGSAGASQSVRVSIPDFTRKLNSELTLGPGLVSRCIEKADFAATKLHLPIAYYDSSSDDGVLPIKVESFESAGCVGAALALPVISAHNDPALASSAQVVSDGVTAEPVYFFRHPLAYGQIAFGGSTSIAFNTCLTKTVDILDSSSVPVTVSTNTMVSMSQTPTYNAVFYTSHNCTGTGYTSPQTLTVTAGSSSASFSMKLFKGDVTIAAYLGSLSTSQVVTYSGGPPSHGSVPYSLFQAMDPLIMTNYNIGSTTSNVQVGSRALAIYGNTYTEMEFTAVGPTAVSFVYRHMDSSYVLLRNQATAVTLIHAGGYACVDLETGNVVANPSSTGTEWCYNNLGFFNPYDTLGPRGIFILQY